MTEPVITPTAFYTIGSAAGMGYLFGMPVGAVVLAAVGSAAVIMISPPKSRWMAVSYVIIGGLLGGALAPPITHILVVKFSAGLPELAEQRQVFANTAAPVLVGLLWQVGLRVASVLWPSFEKRADDVVAWILSLRISWRDKK